MDEAYELISLLTQKGKTVVTGESCTGGLLGALLTAVPGASKVFLGGAVTYTYDLKERLLGVKHKLLEEKGAICAEVAEQMAIGAIQRIGGDFALAVTGNAGPGADPTNPNVGEIYIACAGENTCVARRLDLCGEREENRITACREAIKLLLQTIDCKGWDKS